MTEAPTKAPTFTWENTLPPTPAPVLPKRPDLPGSSPLSRPSPRFFCHSWRHCTSWLPCAEELYRFGTGLGCDRVCPTESSSITKEENCIGAAYLIGLSLCDSMNSPSVVPGCFYQAASSWDSDVDACVIFNAAKTPTGQCDGDPFHIELCWVGKSRSHQFISPFHHFTISPGCML